MYRPTISIRAMFALVAFVGLACIALVRANGIWATLMFTAALSVISFAVLASIYRRGAKQAFWIGCAFSGWLYLWTAHWPGEFSESSLFSGRMQIDNSGTLATTRFISYVYNEWLPTVRTPPAAPNYASSPGGYGGGGFGGYGSGGTITGGSFGGTGGLGTPATGTLVVTPPPPAIPVPIVEYPALHEFMRVGHSLFTMILAFVGGIVASYLYTTRDRAPLKSESPPSPPRQPTEPPTTPHASPPVTPPAPAA